MHAAPVMIFVLCALAIGYRYYSAFIAAKVLVLDDSRVPPAIRLNDSHNYHPTSMWGNGRSLAEIARQEIGSVAGGTAAAAILFIILLALAGLGLVVVKALGGERVVSPEGGIVQIAGSSWGTFTIFCTIPIALFV